MAEGIPAGIVGIYGDFVPSETVEQVLPGQHVLRILDSAHEQGFRAFLTEIGHNEELVAHHNRASFAMEDLRNDLLGNAGPDYGNPYIATAYIVSYHLQHCILAYWSFNRFFDCVDVPETLYVCDVGAGTGAGRVGLALALSERGDRPQVYFDAFEPSGVMLSAGERFWDALSESLVACVSNAGYREFQAMPDELPSIPNDAMRLITAFHLSLPYDNWQTVNAPARRSLQNSLRLVTPSAGLFTCHEGKVNTLRDAIGDHTRWVGADIHNFDIPDGGGGVNHPSRFYTNCAVDLGFDVPEVSGLSVRTWSRHRFSPPSGRLMLRVARREEPQRRVSAQLAEEDHRRQEEARIERQRRVEEASQHPIRSEHVTAPRDSGIERRGIRRLADEQGQRFKEEIQRRKEEAQRHGESLEQLKSRGDSGAEVISSEVSRRSVRIQVGDKVRITGFGEGTVRKLKKNRANVLLDKGYAWEGQVSELKPV